ncbi:hypothetical protein G6F62_014665 [Rhizopus arrhizus]|nr:hypothetical protein G6F62_014665 [Rhizopus arrhizus]
MAGRDLRLGAFHHCALLLGQLLGLPAALGQLPAQRLQLLLRGVALGFGRGFRRIDLRLLALQLLQLLRGAAQLGAQALFHAFGLRAAGQAQPGRAQGHGGGEPPAATRCGRVAGFIPYDVHVHGLRTWR